MTSPHRPARRPALQGGAASTLAAALIAVAISGCGGSSPPAAALHLGDYLIRGHEQTGFSTVGHAETVATPGGFALGDPHAVDERRELTAADFRQSTRLHTGSASGEGVSTVIELASASSAETLMRSRFRSLVLGAEGSAGRFTAPAIPESLGATGTSTPGRHFANLLFREGRCLLVIGEETSSTSYRQSVIAAADSIYTRTHHRSGACSY